MSVRSTNLVTGEYYHIYNRGNSKQAIFLDNDDYSRFCGLLFAFNQNASFRIENLGKGKNIYEIEKQDKLVDIGAYCLMPNHFHILIKEVSEKGISRFMQKLSTAYSMYFNKKYKRTGSLFEGKFKSQLINNDCYFKYLFSYVHLNPIKLIQKDWKEVGVKDKTQTLEYLKGYPYSSYLDYLKQERIQGKILQCDSFPAYFPNKDSFTQEIFEWLKYKDF